ncbi:MAG: xanthine dehydrogenase family protein molybdopterin-binding subunit, partial [Rhizobiales bacterium]|nr:xanthine dehydrogenase family protein molybdopterin-binding subunit [Hyphomicrobiales bacterium]
MNKPHSELHGEKFRRVEDEALVSGQGRFVDDIARDGIAYAVFMRSPHAFARIKSIETNEARKAPGVLAVLTADDMKKAGSGNIARHPPIPGRGGAKMALSNRPALAGERVTHIGEPIAMVVATTQLSAIDAAELVAVDFEEMQPVVDLHEAEKPGAPQIFPDIPGNLCLDWPGMVADPDANAHDVDAIFKSAAHVARVSVAQQRLIVASMEPRGATATYDKATDRYTLRACSQGAGPLRDQLVGAMNLPKEKLRVVTEDVGGAFGMKSGAYPEYVALMVAARLTGRQVHW